MRVLNVTLGFLPAISWGGPVKVVHQNSLELQRRGGHVRICASNLLDKHHHIAPGSFQRQVDGLPVLYLDTRLLPWWPGTTGPTFLSPAALRRLWRAVRDADIVHIHGTRNMLVLAAAWFARWQRKPLVVQPHGTLQYIVASLRLKRLYDALLLRPLLRRAAVGIALTTSEVEQMAAAGIPRARIRPLANGLNPTPPSPAAVRAFRARLGVADDAFLILFLGRINRKKGADLLVEAFARMPASIRAHTHLIIAGPDDGQLAAVQGLTARLDLGHAVGFPGLIAAADVPAALAAADLFVLPCRTDTFPMVLVEACAAGAPILVTATCEMAHLLDGVAATVVPVDVDALATAMQELLADETRRAAYRQGGRQLLQTTFSLAAVGGRLEAIYAEARQWA